jgi:hypothetical protein
MGMLCIGMSPPDGDEFGEAAGAALDAGAGAGVAAAGCGFGTWFAACCAEGVGGTFDAACCGAGAAFCAATGGALCCGGSACAVAGAAFDAVFPDDGISRVPTARVAASSTTPMIKMLQGRSDSRMRPHMACLVHKFDAGSNESTPHKAPCFSLLDNRSEVEARDQCRCRKTVACETSASRACV